MSKELAQTVGGRKFAWLIAILAAFAVMAALGTRWQTSSATVTAGDWSITGPFANNNCTGTPTNPFTGTQNVWYCITATSLTAGYQAPMEITITRVDTDISFTGAYNIVSGGPATCSGSGVSVSCTFDSLAGGPPYTVAFRATVSGDTAGGASDVTGTVNDADLSQTAQPIPAANNTVTALTQVVAPTITKSVSPPSVGAGGGSVTWTITVTNTGNEPLTDVDITDTLPAALTYGTVATGGAWSPAPTCSITGNSLACNNGQLPGGATGTINIPATVPADFDGASYPNQASANVVVGSTPTLTFTGLTSNTATLTQASAYLVHIADNGQVITESEVNNNVRGSRHTVCVVTGTGTGLTGVTVPGLTQSNIVIAPSGQMFQDVVIYTADGTPAAPGPAGATCISWRSIVAGDQTISLLVNGQAILGANDQGLVKEWNTLEASRITSGTVSDTGADVTITRTLPVRLNPVTGQYQGTPVTITDTFLGSHTNSAGVKEGPMPLAGVNWTVTKTGCGTLSGATSGTTTLLSTVAPPGSANTHNVGNEPNVTFDPDGCAPGSTATVTITGTEPGAFGSGTGNRVVQRITFSFSAAIPAKHVFLAWAGQRVVLEHNWALDPSNPGASEGTGATGTCPDTNPGNQQMDWPTVRYVKDSGPGNFIPGGTITTINAPNDAQGSVLSQTTQGYAPCTSVAVYESEDQGQVDIEAFITAGQGSGFPASKVAWVVYYMKIERVNLSLVTQVSKPTHNGSAAPDWAPGNPWDASKDDADGTAEWNVSKDILVRGRVSGWFVNSNPSGRPADTSNPLNVLPANRWVMPADWPLLAGGPADPADGSNAIGTAEQFRPYYDIMIDPDPARNGGRSLASPDGLGVYVSGLITNVATPNTGTGSATSPISVGTCAGLTAGTNILIGTVVKTVVSCTGTSLVISVPFSAPVAAGTPIFSIGGLPFIGPYSALDIFAAAPVAGPNQPNDGSLAPTSLPGHSFRDTVWKDGDVDWWDAPMPPAPVSVALRGTGFIKQVIKSDVYYTGTPNAAAVVNGGDQRYPNPYYWTEIPESPAIPAVAAGGGFLWDSWGTSGPYRFWVPVRIGVNSAGIGETLSSADITELGIIRTAYGDTTIARDLVVFSDNHGEFMVAANGDFKTDLSACATNALAGGKHCKPGDKVGRGTIVATADYPDFRGKHFPVASNAVTVDWTWGGYKDVTIQPGETDQFKYVVFHALDRDGFCSVPTGAVSLHPVLSSADAGNDFSSLGARYNGDPVENVDFLIDSGEGIIIAQSGGGTINDGRRFATGVTTFSVAANDPAVTGIKEFPLSPLAAQGQTDECQAWIKVSNSLLGIVNVLVIAHDDEGNIGFDRVIDLQTTTSYTLNFRWSLITWAGANNIPVMDAIKGTGKNEAGNDISASVTAIYGWDAPAQRWLGFFPAGVNVPGANDLTALKKGEAYWIAITGPSSVTWTIATNVD